MVIDNMLSYQVNNLMSDKSVFESPVNTVDELTLDQYHTIRQSFSKQKSAKGVIDYDDMQSTLYLWLVKYIQSDKPEIQEIGVNVRNYCKAVWTDFYIDEAQDVSKIQFAIIRALVEDPDNKGKLDRGLVFIGDDDQCLDSETIVKTLKEDKKIKDIEVGDKVISIMNDMYCCSTVKEKLEHTINKGRFMVKISTKLGYSLNVTDDHKTMVKIPECLLKNQSITYKDKIYVLRDTDKIININSDEELESYGFRLDLPHGGNGVKVENYYTIINAISAVNGMKVGLYVNGKFFDDEIVSVDVQEVLHPIKVYDINLDRNHNFIANNILTHNCIYQWRGSDPSIILSVGPTFDMPTFVLSTNYRCYNEIVDYATTGIKCNSNRYNKGMNAYERGGDVKILPSSKRDLCSLSILAMNQIKEWLASGDDADSIAVLSRNNFHLAILNNMLLREGIYCNTTNDMKLTKSYMYKDIKDVITIATEPCWKGELTSRILWRLCRYMGAGPSSFIGKFQDSNALELKDALGYLIKNYIDKEIDFDKKVNVNIQEAEKVRNVIYRFSQETVEDLKYVYNCLTCEDKHRALTTLMYCYSQASSFLYKSTDKSRSINGLIKYITNLSLKDGVDKMKDFLRVTEQLEYGRMVINGPKVTLTTIHSAKGREWKNVIMFACDNVSMPNTESIATMSLGGVDNSSIDEYIDEERRLFYVGNTRAKENLLVLTYDEPSYFVMESLGMFEEGNNNENVKKYSSNPEKAESLNKRFNELIKDPSNKYYYDIDKLPVGMEAAITPLESKEETQKAC
jgi:superfamily I DNA/RNA helicase